jgi:hypothetical protein
MFTFLASGFFLLACCYLWGAVEHAIAYFEQAAYFSKALHFHAFRVRAAQTLGALTASALLYRFAE